MITPKVSTIVQQKLDKIMKQLIFISNQVFMLLFLITPGSYFQQTEFKKYIFINISLLRK